MSKPKILLAHRASSLGDRMKMYEGAETSRHFLPTMPIVARVDGRAFHTFTNGLIRPYDERFKECMVRTAEALLVETGAVVAYRQSDEITIVWPGVDDPTRAWFGGRAQKMCSMIASIATVEFNNAVRECLPAQYAKKKPMFDARVWQVPTMREASNVLIWREHDAIKNSIMALATECVGHNRVLGKHTKEQLELIKSAGKNWDTFPDWARRGTYLRRVSVERKFTADELESLPPQHTARTNPDLVFTRNVVKELEIPYLATLEPAERIKILFGDE
jgi:tRNA(His) guanylyltransferase